MVLVTGVAAACGPRDDTPENAVHVLTATGTVGPVMDQYIDRGISKAEANQARLVVIQLDTPGGLNTSMESIVKRILRSGVPVAVYVTPEGGRAASAGTFITMAAHIAAMAPNTRIGAASAVMAGGEDIGETLGRKIEEDATALIRALAEERGRNADWAEDAVREARANNDRDALELGVIDLRAATLDDLLEAIDDTDVRLREGVSVEMRGLTDAELVYTDMSFWERVLSVLANPTLASILIALGFLGLIFELSSPGTFIPGTAGAIAMILGFMGLGAMPIETAGLIFIGLALVLFAMEIFVASGGILAAAGAVSMVLGAIIAFRDTPAEFYPNRIVLGFLIVVVVGMFLSMAIGLARVRRIERPSAFEALVGETVVARTPLRPDGYVLLNGERWKAEIEDGVATTGDKLRVTSVEGFKLRVTKERDNDTDTPAPR
jgi:membrane-bound serine protease (ClpP class)